MGAEDGPAEVKPGPDVQQLVQARVDWVARILAPSIIRLIGREGTATLQLAVDDRGYVSEFRFDTPSGSARMDDEVELNLHFAEPFPTWQGWLPVTVRYRRDVTGAPP